MKFRLLRLLWGEWREGFLAAMDALAAHKLRSALTLAGVLIGVFSIIVVMTAMRVLQSYVETELSALGANTFWVRKWPVLQFSGGRDWQKNLRRKNVTYAHAMAVRQRATLAAAVGIETVFWAGEVSSRFGKTPPTVVVFGAVPGNFPARNWTVAEGRGLLDIDVETGSYVCVLGAGVRKALFPTGLTLGDQVKIDGINYTVVGALEPRGSFMGGNQDNFVVIPITTGFNRYGRLWRSLDILVQAPDQETYEETVEQVRGILRAVRKVAPGEEDDFEIFSNESIIRQFREVTFAVRAGAVAVSSIALLAAGIGIMNIMLVSVTERTREIGVRRAVGAKKRNIMTQFTLEAVVLSELGGVAGIVLGVLGGTATALLLELPPVVPVDWIILGVAICSLVGIIFGIYPAYRAANLNPIESLRYE
ncbi:MAG: ABC transporter permease [Verrucomicrobiales bacterium]|nr:ABC transporter permease [Verrucomicrobiales bacterium]